MQKELCISLSQQSYGFLRIVYTVNRVAVRITSVEADTGGIGKGAACEDLQERFQPLSQPVLQPLTGFLPLLGYTVLLGLQRIHPLLLPLSFLVNLAPLPHLPGNTM